MISHDTQLCLTEPEGASEMEREERDKEGEDEGKKESLRKTKEGGGQDGHKTFLERSHCPFIKKQHPTQSLCLSIMAKALLPQAVDTQFADVGTIGGWYKTWK